LWSLVREGLAAKKQEKNTLFRNLWSLVREGLATKKEEEEKKKTPFRNWQSPDLSYLACLNFVAYAGFCQFRNRVLLSEPASEFQNLQTM
jgi:hypothetical protein